MLRRTLQHYANPLHIYCRLRGLLSPRAAMFVARGMAYLLCPLLYTTPKKCNHPAVLGEARACRVPRGAAP